jgi:hypothetical protein
MNTYFTMKRRRRGRRCRRFGHQWKATPANIGSKLYSIMMCARCGELKVDGR